MKKVINITLGGIVFAIEGDAYNTLAQYLESVKQRLTANDDATEIVADIETALAEKFIAKKRDEKRAVVAADVTAVIAEMGAPDDFAEDETDVDTNAAAAGSNDVKKRLYRDADDAVIAGVASGIASYFGIDPVIVRIIFFISIFFNGLGVIAYIILWLVVPKAETTTEKYAMRGANLTLKDISERVKKNLDQVDTSHLPDAQSAWSGIRPVFVKVFAIVGVVARALLQFARVLAGVLLLFGGALALAGLVSVYSIVLLSEKVLLPIEAQTAVEVMLSSVLGVVAISASFVMMMIPLLVFILLGASVLLRRNLFTAGKAIALAVVWIVAIVLAFTTSALQLERVFEKLDIEEFSGDSYQIQINVADDHIDFAAQVTEPGTGTDSDLPTSSIAGVTVYDGVTVPITSTRLDLSSQGLTGSLTAEVRQLSELRVLDMSDNDLTGLPAEVGQLSNLEVLDLSNNPLTGLPHEIGNLQNLTTLDLRGTSYSEFDLEIIAAGLPGSTQILK